MLFDNRTKEIEYEGQKFNVWISAPAGEYLKKDKEGLTLEKDKVWQQVEHYQRLLPEPKAAPAVGKTRKKKESSKPKKKGFWAQAFGR